MTGYEQYISDVKSGKQIACRFIKQAVDRFEEFRNREDIYFDNKCVDEAISFIKIMKHYLGKSAGQHFELLPWQQFLLANILGLKYKSNGLRVCREVYLQMARKQGKTALIAAIALYFLIVDGEASPEIACLATSREQSRICFDMITNFAKSIDPKSSFLKYYRNYIKLESNNGQCKVFSSDSSKLDGLNIQLGIIDEAAALPNNMLYSVIKSSMGMRLQPLLIQITTPQFSLSSPAYQTYQMSLEILSGLKTNDNFFPFIYTLDEDDEWDDENVWIKSNPSMGQTVTIDFIKGEVQNAKNDYSQEVPVKIKNIGIWTQSQSVWIPQEKVVKCMGEVKMEDYQGQMGYLGVDLSSVNDMTALALCIPLPNNKFAFKVWCWVPEDTYENSPNKELYRDFINDGSLLITPGNVVDYDSVKAKMGEISKYVQVMAVFYDQWNATSWAIDCTEAGYNLIPFSQSIGHYNNATKAMAKLILNQDCIIDKSRNLLWQFGNCIIKQDINGNQKVTKEEYLKKVDGVIAMTTAIGGYYEENTPTDTDIIFF